MGTFLAAYSSRLVSVLVKFTVISYAILVIQRYVSEGPRYQFKFDVHYPVHSSERLVVGVGVRSLAWLLRLAGFLLAPLFEASAEVGEWASAHTSPETQARLRSRYLRFPLHR